MEYLKIKNWDKWQTYRSDRGTPPWIKVHRKIMTNKKWAKLSDKEKGQILSIWIVAADDNGKVPADPTVLKKVCHLDSLPNIKLFKELELLTSERRHDDVNMASERRHLDAPETEKSRDRIEKTQSGLPDLEDFERLWKRYKGEPDGKKLARGYFNAQFKNQKDLDDYGKAEQNYYAIVEADFEGRRLKSGKVWFNNWRDYIDMEPEKVPELDPRDDPLDPLYEPGRNGNGAGP